MLCVNAYPREYVDECRTSVAEQLAAYDALVAAARACAGAGDAALNGALDAFEPVFFNDLLLVMDSYFTHRSRTLELKDGNPLNEARVLSGSLMLNHGIVTGDKSIKWNPAAMVLKYEVGDQIRLSEHDFQLIADAFFAEIEAKFVS